MCVIGAWSRKAAMSLVAVGLAAAASCDSSNPSAPTPVCTFALSSDSASVPSEGGTGTVEIRTDSPCAWSITGVATWIALESPASGTGPATVRFAVLPNAEQAPRQARLTLAGRPFTIDQTAAAACAYSIAPEQQAFDDEGGAGQVQVTTAVGCSWTATRHAEWIRITANAEGNGPAAVAYAVVPNNATASRSGTLTVAGRTLTITQAGEDPGVPVECTYRVSPVAFSPCMASGTLTVSLSTTSGCEWTLSSSASWLRPTGGLSGRGSQDITVAFTDNYDPPRHATLMVRWPTPTAGQNVQVAQAGCLYGVTQETFTFASTGGAGSFTVVQQSDPNSCGGALQDRCIWTARASVPWIVVTSSMPRQGDNPVAFTVAGNTGTTARTGQITVRSRTVTITQAAP